MKASEPCLFADMQARAIEPLSIDDMSNPRIRIWNAGGESLSNTELLSIIIGKGVGTLSSMDIARSIMQECDDNWGELARMKPYDLYRHLGVGTAKAAKILAAIEVAKRMQVEKALQRRKLDSALDIYEYLKPTMAYESEEHGRVLLLSHNFNLIKDVELSKGGLTETAIDIRVIAREALIHNATVVALAHNHPSGNLRPSSQDDSLTHKVQKAMETLRLHFLDHVIVTDGGYYSYSEEGRL